MLLPILKFPDQRLRDPSLPVPLETIASDEFQTLLQNMFETMYTAPGVGLAAVQIGVHQRVMTLDIGINEGELIKRDPKVVINPEIVVREGEIVWEEGCLSCPDLVVPVKRSQRVVVKALNRHHKFLRGRLGHAIDMKFTPELKFLHDDTFDEAARISAIFADPKVAQDLKPSEPSDSWKDED